MPIPPCCGAACGVCCVCPPRGKRRITIRTEQANARPCTETKLLQRAVYRNDAIPVLPPIPAVQAVHWAEHGKRRLANPSSLRIRFAGAWVSDGSEDPQQYQNQNNGENQAEPATAVIAPARADAIAAIAKSQNEQQQKNDQQHGFPPCIERETADTTSVSFLRMSTPPQRHIGRFDSQLGCKTKHGCCIAKETS